jgi:hypothetical protein
VIGRVGQEPEATNASPRPEGTRSRSTGKEWKQPEEMLLPDAIGCARCGEAATTVVVELSAVTAYLDVCESHLAELLRGAHPVKDRRPTASSSHLGQGTR